MRLSEYNNAWFERGKPRLVEAAWLILQALFVSSWLPGAAHRRFLLRMFGAQIGRGVDIKPGVRVTFPWRLTVGDYTWLGEKVWLDNLADIRIGSNCCISQGAYLCTGNHDWSRPTFDLSVTPIVVEDSAWVGAHASVAPGTHVAEGAMLVMGSVGKGQLAAWTIYQGVPATPVGRRVVEEAHSPA